MYGWSNRGKSSAGRYIFFGRGGRIIRSSRFSFPGRRALSGFLSAGISGRRALSGFLPAGIPGRRVISGFLPAGISGRRVISGFLSAGISGRRVISAFLSAGISGRRVISAFLLMPLVRGRNIGDVFVACFGRSSCIGGVSNINRAGRTYITLIMNFYKIAVFCSKSIVLEI